MWIVFQPKSPFIQFVSKLKLMLLCCIGLLSTGFYPPPRTAFSFTTIAGKRFDLIVKAETVCVFFGTSSTHIECCQTLNTTKGTITYSYYMRPVSTGDVNGLDLNHIRFLHNGFRYDVYEEYGEEGDVSVGVRITHVRTGASVEEPAQKRSVKGSMISLRHAEILPEVPSDF